MIPISNFNTTLVFIYLKENKKHIDFYLFQYNTCFYLSDYRMDQ